nr:MAG TPA: hypothetical protein [Caudoviricetes sp.]
MSLLVDQFTSLLATRMLAVILLSPGQRASTRPLLFGKINIERRAVCHACKDVSILGVMP